MPVFFITADQIHNKTATITGPLLDHLRASLRVQAGEQITLGDSQRRVQVQVEHVTRHELIGRVIQESPRPPSRTASLILLQALLKGERMDWAIQKSTELGVRSIFPLITRRGVVRPEGSRVTAQVARWRRIALEAAQQSEQWQLPEISPPRDSSEGFRLCPTPSVRVMLSERKAGHSLATIALPQGAEQSVVLAVGPEGGWTEEEIEAASACGFVPVTLGTMILRAETAALAAVSIVQSRLGELG